VESFIGRDIKMEELSNMVEKLDNWCSNCMQVLQAVEGEMTRANLVKMEHSRSRDKREVELKQLKETLKVASTLEGEVRQSTSQPPREPANTTAKKGLRGSAAEETQSIRKVIHFAGN
jgi:COP9 signalosome complex subunit 7